PSARCNWAALPRERPGWCRSGPRSVSTRPTQWAAPVTSMPSPQLWRHSAGRRGRPSTRPTSWVTWTRPTWSPRFRAASTSDSGWWRHISISDTVRGTSDAPTTLPRRREMLMHDQSSQFPNGPLQPGTRAPAFSLRDTPDQSVSLSELRGRIVILVFYPADWSPVCGSELALYNELLPEFQRFGATLLGVSADLASSHLAS